MSNSKQPRVKVAYVISNGPGTLLEYGRGYDTSPEIQEIAENVLDYPNLVMAISPSKEFEGTGA